MGTTAPVSDFGSPVNEKTLPRINAIIVAVAGLAFASWALSTGKLDGTVIGVLLFALCLLALCAWSFTYKATIYENGATVTSILGTRSLRFQDLRSFGYSRVQMRGQPTDTLVFVPRTGKPVRIVTQPDFRVGPDADLARLLDDLTPIFADRMEKELARAKRVVWVERAPRSVPAQPGVTLTREAFVVDDGAEPLMVAFTEADATVVSGVLRVVQIGTRKLLLSVPCSAQNFYPGFMLLQRLTASALAPAIQAPAVQ